MKHAVCSWVLLGTALLLVGCTGAVRVAPAPVGGVVVVRTAPPPPQVEAIPAAPGPHEVWFWQRGHWRWNGASYYWVPGHWVQRPSPGVVWVEPSWQNRNGGWVFIEGHWR